MKLDDLVFHVGWETLSKTGLLFHGDGVICAYLVNAFFHEFQLVGKLSSVTKGLGRGKFAGGV